MDSTKVNVTFTLRLTPSEANDLTLASNCISTSLFQGAVYLDFGFIEPDAVNALVAKQRHEDLTGNQFIDGRRVVRIVTTPETLNVFRQQLEQLLRDVGLVPKDPA